MACHCWENVGVRLPAKTSLIPPWLGEVGEPCYSSPPSLKTQGWPLYLCDDESSEIPLGLLWHHPRGGKGTLLQLVKVDVSTAPLLVRVWVGSCFFSVVFGWRRILTVHKFSVLLGCPFPGPLTREREQIFFFFFGLSLLLFLDYQPFSTKTGIYEKETQAPYHHILWVPGSLAALPSLQCSDSS